MDPHGQREELETRVEGQEAVEDTVIGSNTPTSLGEGSVPTPLSTLGEGATLGAYVLERKLGAGGMGSAYVARKGTQRVALKILSRVSGPNLLRFKNEFRALADVRHRNLVELFELDTRQRAFFTMELLEDAEPFVSWVRREVETGQPPALERLEHALGQLAEGIAELHRRGFVHRDLKPSNVLVTSGGRVVILDFGLVAPVDKAEPGLTQDGQILGTPAYMAPEQALGLATGAAADLYAIGVMLHECLVGRLPHVGSVLKILADKQESVELDAALLEAPARLRTLCLSLLQRDPEQRCDLAGLLGQLDARPGQLDARPLDARPIGERFIGRKRELARLREAYDALVDTRAPVVVHLRGRSGQGKSTLLRRVRTQLRDEPCIVLEARSREREAVPYRGVDAVIDGLATHLRRLADDELACLRPSSVAALVRMFPVLDELWPEPEPLHLSPRELRGAAWGALRELFAALAERRVSVLLLDDFQWSDLDSVQLLEELLRPPRAPSMLVVLALRNDVGESEILAKVSASPTIGESVARTLELGPLSEHEARELARMFVREREPGRAALRAESVAIRSGGNPFFIAQMGRSDSDAPAASHEDLDDFVVHRLAQLDAPQRRLLELLAVAGGPLERDLCLALCPEAELATLESLIEDGLLAASAKGAGVVRIETAHDRIREVTLAQLEPGARAQLHTSIGARLLADSEGALDNEVLFRGVEQLNAGVETLAALDDEQRSALAGHNREAGERALATGAWVTARRHFGVAFDCIEPWLPEARRGAADQVSRCAPIVFGLAQALGMCEDPDSDARFEDLLSWPLSADEHGRYLVQYMVLLTASSRFEACFRHGADGLARLGVKLPREPSALRAGLAFIKGWRAVQKHDLSSLVALPSVSDDHQRLIMSMMASLAIAALPLEPNYATVLIGRHAELTTRWGYHDGTPPALIVLGTVAGTLGKAHAAAALVDDMLELAKQRPVQATALLTCRMIAGFFVYPRVRPLSEVAQFLTESRGLATRIGDRRSAEWATAFLSSMHLDAGTPLAQVIALTETLQRESASSDAHELARDTEVLLRLARALVSGSGDDEIVFSEDLSGITKVAQYAYLGRVVMFAILFARHDRAYEAQLRVCDDYIRVLTGSYFTPMFAMFGVIVLVERAAQRQRGASVAARRQLRRYQGVLRRWAADCPENFGSMSDIAAAEVLGLEGRLEQATSSYERAIESALRSGMSWAAGLAGDRLGQLARRRGQTLLATAGFETARRIYEDWGAHALVRRLDDELARERGRFEGGA